MSNMILTLIRLSFILSLILVLTWYVQAGKQDLNILKLRPFKDTQLVRYSKVCPEYRCAHKNYGDSTELQFGSYQLLSDVLIAFKLPTTTVPDGSVISSADLLFPPPNRNTVVGGEPKIAIFRVVPQDVNWTEHGVSWMTRPSHEKNPLAVFSMTPYGGVAHDLISSTSLTVSKETRELNLYLKPLSPTFFEIESRESGIGGPMLRVEYTLPPTAARTGLYGLSSSTQFEILIGIGLIVLASLWWAYNSYFAGRGLSRSHAISATVTTTVGGKVIERTETDSETTEFART